MNQFGLSRNIPNQIKYQIRKDDGFGCVHCGLSIYEYEHIVPEFKDAKEHDPKRIALLCPTEHSKVTRKFTSKETVESWKKTPWSKIHGHVHDVFDFKTNNLEIWIGSAKIVGYEKIITVDDQCLLEAKPPEKDGNQFQLSASFFDNQNKPILTIKDNEWQAMSDAFDIVTSEGKIGIRKDGKFVLKIFIFPPNKIVFEEIDMLYKGFVIQGDSKSLKINGPVTGEGEFFREMSFTSNNISNSLLSAKSDQPGFIIGAGKMANFSDTKRPYKASTAHKCDRNAPCPCGSNKKYKLCCIPKYDYVL